MKRKISLVLYEEHPKINLYSYSINDSPINEVEKFILSLENQNRTSDIIQIVNLIDRIGENGAFERYFRYEGKMADHVFALPDHYLIKTDCRLYCIRYNDSLVILGNGGIKTTSKYQGDPFLNDCVETLQKIDRELMKMVQKGQFTIDNKLISGKVEFYI